MPELSSTVMQTAWKMYENIGSKRSEDLDFIQFWIQIALTKGIKASFPFYNLPFCSHVPIKSLLLKLLQILFFYKTKWLY